MPQHHTTADQVQFVGEWFRSWSEMQRTDFLPTLVKELRPSHHMNGGLHQNIHNLSLSSRPPSIYNCQVKLFQDWVVSWSAEERAKLLLLLREEDSNFSQSLDSALDDLDGRKSADGAEGAALPAGDVAAAPPPAGVVAAAPPPAGDVAAAPPPAGDVAAAHVAAAPPAGDMAVAPPPAGEQPGPAVAEVALPAPVAPMVPGAGAREIDSEVDEALDSSPSSTLSSPECGGEGRADSGLDSPVGTQTVEEEEDEGGHVIIVQQDENPRPAPLEGNPNNEEGAAPENAAPSAGVAV